MKIQTMSALMVFAVASLVSTAQGQRPPRPSHQPVPPQPPSQFERRLDPPRLPSGHNVPSTSILPMTNPIAPIVTSPIQPFIRYGPIPEVVFPTRAPARPSRPDYGRRGYNDPTVIVGGGYWGFPGYYYPYPYTPAPVAGELPYTYPYVLPPVAGQLPNTIPTVVEYPPDVVPAPAVPSVPVSAPETEFFPQQNMIITPPVPERTVVPPAIGTSKTDVLARHGDPWGSVRIGGRETLYFSGGLELVFENDVLVQVK